MSNQQISRTNLGELMVSNYELYYDFHLFIAGNDPASEEAHTNLRQICETYLAEHYELQITDINEDFSTVLKNGILVTPTLKVVIAPKGQPPLKPITIIGTLTDTQRVLAVLLVKG